MDSKQINLLSDTPTYNLKAAVQETGLKPDTLRAWERRYGLPDPLRTESGHRLYSQRDISTLKWLVERQAEGLSISRAVALWKRLKAEEKEETEEPPINIEIHSVRAEIEANVSRIDGASDSEQIKDSCRQWINACLAFDEQAARRVIEQAFAIFSPEFVCTQILQNGLAKIGDEWENGNATAQQEHFASSLVMGHLQALLTTTPAPTRSGRILVGCSAGEEHAFPALLVALFLRRKGWHVIYLGADIPRRSFEKTLTSSRPDMVVLVAQQLHTAVSLHEMAHVLYERRIPLGYGGRIFAQTAGIQNAIAGHYLGDTIVGGVKVIEELMQIPRPRNARHQPTHQSIDLLNAFRAKLPLIEAQVWQKLHTIGLPFQTVSNANTVLGRVVLAHLTLYHTASSIENSMPRFPWVKQLLINHHQMSASKIELFLNVYLEAIVEHLPENGLPIAERLKPLMS